MKKFSVNLLKVGVLIILGLCMMGAMSQVNALASDYSELDVNFIKEDKIELMVGQTSSLNIDLKNSGVSLEKIATAERNVISENPDVAKITAPTTIKAIAPGTTKVVLRYTKYDETEGHILYYDVVEVEVIDDSKATNETNNSKFSGLGNGFSNILNIIMNVITKIVGVITKLFANIPIKTILPK